MTRATKKAKETVIEDAKRAAKNQEEEAGDKQTPEITSLKSSKKKQGPEKMKISSVEDGNVKVGKIKNSKEKAVERTENVSVKGEVKDVGRESYGLTTRREAKSRALAKINGS